MIDTDHYVNRSDMSTSLDLTADMVNEAREKLVLHWNYRGLSEIPEAVRHVGAQVQEIYLKWNELKSLPIWLADFASVTNLYLYGNKIERLPDTLGLMTKLTVLDLSANRLEELPDCLGSLEALRSLLLNQNYIASLPTSMSKLRNLEYLCLSGNQLVVLPEWLGSLPNLAELFADNNNLREIPNRLTLSTSLDTLSVCSNKLSHLPLNGFASSPQIRFDSNSRLNYLSLPVFCQLVSKLRQSPSQGNTIAYGYAKKNLLIKTIFVRNPTNASVINNAVMENFHEEIEYDLFEMKRSLLRAYQMPPDAANVGPQLAREAA
ncbi:plant intracellular Ras-group-related LRR protein 5-like [Copidosoma floridanum]|uniref:plant intracellular Ras-group-related LRR protein 5-like n=1 Tax=Copidosoma floridanum TaxID=29053 RepID=UPI000C6FB01C|nr:plant intracellular Ras-group-related LRR protein 5-like [Copidosoma floridanum]